MELWYKQPAELWEEALPIGNGRLGAMVCGRVQKETIYLNEDSVWYGNSIDRINEDALPNLDLVRALIFDGEIKEAEDLLRKAFSGTPQSQRPFQPLGQLDLTFHGIAKEVEQYERKLDLSTGICTTSFSAGDVKYHREIFSSYMDKAIIMRLSCNKKGSLNFDLLLTRERFYDGVGKLNDKAIFMEGNLGKGGVEFITGVGVSAQGGKIRCVGEHLVVEGADEVILYLGADTSFYVKNPRESLEHILNHLPTVSYEELKKRHVEDFSSIMNRVSLNLKDSDLSKLPTNERKDAFGKGAKDDSFAALYFQFGRYLLLSSSRPGSLPTNLQGIWNNEMKPSWDSKYTININTEMNYWPAQMCNLSECHLPLFDHLERMVISGKETARKMYGCRGFCAHHNTDLWADSAPQDIYIPATYWTQGGAWLCTHLWSHYRYTMDREWLGRVAYPILREAVLFYHDFLVEKDGLLVTCPSVSPENTYIFHSKTKSNDTVGCVCYGPTMDNQIIRDIFTQYLAMIKELKIEDDLQNIVDTMLHKLPKTQIGKHGQIMEWCIDYEDAEPGHRHISHLYGLHPSKQITIEDTPDLVEAAKVTLKRRLEHGGGHTGWSCAWILNFYARLEDGDMALSFLHRLMKQSTFSNLMDNHPRGKGAVFQIDGNLGACAGIAEMLVQSYEDRIKLLPALPEEWADGEVKGLCIYGGATIDIRWENHELKSVALHGKESFEVRLLYKKKEFRITTNCGEICCNC